MTVRALAAAAALATAALAAPAGALPRTEAVIVLLRPGTSPADVLARYGVAALPRPGHVWTGAVDGFALAAPAPVVAALAGDADVVAVEPDVPVAVEPFDQVYAVAPAGPQRTPHGVLRIGAAASHQHSGDGKGAVPLGVAVLDTGVAHHPDLDVRGGYDCTGAGTYDDRNGHGTHVAGTIAAKDDGAGVVGVAPGARVYGIRVLGPDGKGSSSDMICGLDWVYRHAGTVDVANMSVVVPLKTRGDATGCAAAGRDGDVLHVVTCAVVGRGVLLVASAGNDTKDFRQVGPAAYREVLTVTAMADFDGAPGGYGERACGADGIDAGDAGTAQADLRDDAAAPYSNFAPADGPAAAHTVAAPGTCVLSTWLNGGYAMIQGTSMAAPHVAGLALLCLDARRCPRHRPATTIRTIAQVAKAHWQSGFSGSPTSPVYDKAMRAYRWYGPLVNAATF